MFVKYNALTFIWWMVMSVLLFLPGDSLPETDQWNIVIPDKLVHFGLFTIFAFLMRRGFARQTRFVSLRKYSVKCTVAITVTYAIVAEYLQQLASDRSFEWQDMVANLLGSMAGLIIFYLFNKI